MAETLTPPRKKSIFGGVVAIPDKPKKSKHVQHIVVYLPANYPSCPPGLERLIPIDHLFVRQGIRETEPPFTMISKNKFEVLDGAGRRIFMARDSNQNILKLCCRGGCGQPFRMSIKEKLSGYEILAVNSRPDCYGAMSASISQNGMNLGFLSEDIRCCSSNYVVIDAQGTEIFRIYDASQGSPYSKGSYKRQEMMRQAEARREQEELKQNEIEERKKRKMRRCRHRKSIPTTEEDKHGHFEHGDDEGIDSAVASTSKDVSKITQGESSGPRSEDFETSFTTTKAQSSTLDGDYGDTENGESSTNTELTRKKRKSVAFSSTRNDDHDQDLHGRGPLQNIPFDAMSIEELDTVSESTPSGCICGYFCNRLRNLASCLRRSSNQSRRRCDLGLGTCVGKGLDSCVSTISGGAEFSVYSCQLGVVVGRMGKQWDSLYDHYFNLQECFGASFPRSLSVRHKALLLGALFLLDFNHFQL